VPLKNAHAMRSYVRIVAAPKLQRGNFNAMIAACESDEAHSHNDRLRNVGRHRRSNQAKKKAQFPYQSRSPITRAGKL
jgi:hypothetical protein